MTEIMVSAGVIESHLGLSALNAVIIDVSYNDIDGNIYLKVESLNGEPLPSGTFKIQTTRSVDSKLVPA